jgi:hypothetical protein
MKEKDVDKFAGGTIFSDVRMVSGACAVEIL